MTFRFKSSSPVDLFRFEGGSPNVLGCFYGGGSNVDLHMVTVLNKTALGEPVELKFSSRVNIATTLTVSLSDVTFYKLPWLSYPNVPDCAVIQSPSFVVHSKAPSGLVMEVSNASALPLTVMSLDLAEASSLLPLSALDWDDPAFNALPWQTAVPGGMVLDAAGPPIMVDLPDAAAAGPAVLCRFISVYGGQEVRGIMQVNLDSPPLGTKSATWGKVKSLYRN